MVFSIAIRAPTLYATHGTLSALYNSASVTPVSTLTVQAGLRTGRGCVVGLVALGGVDVATCHSDQPDVMADFAVSGPSLTGTDTGAGAQFGRLSGGFDHPSTRTFTTWSCLRLHPSRRR